MRIAELPRLIHPLPKISMLISDEPGRIYWRVLNGGYSQDAITDCGHNWICICDWKFDGYETILGEKTKKPRFMLGVEHSGVCVKCFKCGRIQAFGKAS